MKGMPAISLWQPWASLVIDGHKKIETRTHNRFSSLGCRRVAIHATAWPGRAEHRRRWITAKESLQRHWTEMDVASYLFGRNHWHGAVIGTACIVDHRRMTRSDEKDALCGYDPGRHAIVLADIVYFYRPIRAKGHQGIWYWDAAAELRGED